MNLIKADLWECNGALCITTNGFVKVNGRAVMGAGVAKQATQLIPGIDKELGRRLYKTGNNVYRIAGPDHRVYFDRSVLSFPVKHNWYERADLDLIRESAEQLSVVMDNHSELDFFLVKPGCGNGGLTWSVVEDTLDPVLARHTNLFIVDR